MGNSHKIFAGNLTGKNTWESRERIIKENNI
jgi:hypothetical protein